MFLFYIIYSTLLDRFYYGSCENLDERLRRHNTNHKGWTGKTNDWKIVYSESFVNKNDALARERQIKSWKNRKRIEALFKNGKKDNSHRL